MVNLALIVSLYYNMIVGWAIIYLFKIVTGQSHQWSSCENEFNTICTPLPIAPSFAHISGLDCTSTFEDERCSLELFAGQSFTESSLPAFYFNGSCHRLSNAAVLDTRSQLFAEKSATSPSEEFFE